MGNSKKRGGRYAPTPLYNSTKRRKRRRNFIAPPDLSKSYKKELFEGTA